MEATLNSHLELMMNRIMQLEQDLASAQLHQAPTTITSKKEPKINSPAPFSGRKDEAMEFLLKCDMVFDTQPQTYALNTTRIAFVTNLLKDEAYRWVMPHLMLPQDQKPAWVQDWSLFKEEFKRMFEDTNIIETARHKLKTLRQTGSATSYATEFQRHAAYLNWNDEALRHNFFDGLKDDVKDKILTPNNFKTFGDLVNNSIKWDDLLFQRRKGTPFHKNPTPARLDTPVIRNRPFTFQPSFRQIHTPSHTSTSASAGPTPMEVDAVRPRFSPLTNEERTFRINNKLCLYCGKPGHMAHECRVRSNNRTPSKVNATINNNNNNNNNTPVPKNSKPQV
ncbi:hypothetical protein M231_03361 [Tremella mesenterica]|uniref:CCHC-type domain-containing protein n=1 Tax=Tremella mesenterica TaxID=5217 RepID=A0A4Q1BNG4_TREME|nr:hypothetical protein M231_03361 [Tremella mesenterica]